MGQSSRVQLSGHPGSYMFSIHSKYNLQANRHVLGELSITFHLTAAWNLKMFTVMLPDKWLLTNTLSVKNPFTEKHH